MVRGPQLQYRQIKEREEYREATRGHNWAKLIGACSRTLSNAGSIDLNPTERNDPLIVYRESGAERERRVGVTRSRVGMVSLAERDANHGGSDLPNRVGQVIGWIRKGRNRQRGSAAWKRGWADLTNGLKVEWGSGLGLKAREQREETLRNEDEGHEATSEASDETRTRYEDEGETRRGRG